MERIDDCNMARRVMIGEVSRKWVRGRQRLGWMDGVNVVLGSRGITLESTQ